VTAGHAGNGVDDLLLISADSHVFEPVSVWGGLLPPTFWPDEGKGFAERPAGHDPEVRLQDMATDGVSAEVLYPSLGLPLFGIDDVALHEAACHAYNQWLAAFCRPHPDRLLAIGMVPTFGIDRALAEIAYCADQGFEGLMVWQAPHPDLPFTSAHYERVWADAAARQLPVSLHILTGFNYSRGRMDLAPPLELYRGSVNLKLLSAMDAVFDLVFGGALERHPDLRIVLVENEVGWLPFVIDQWDYYVERFGASRPLDIARQPSQIIRDQVRVTFFRDPTTAHLFDWWGADICMWSSDYPHGNSTWPHSRQHVARNLGGLERAVQDRIVRRNVADLYGLETASLPLH
jgi:predicted TIM-barrel fold metal-dependent hydrolase